MEHIRAQKLTKVPSDQHAAVDLATFIIHLDSVILPLLCHLASRL